MTAHVCPPRLLAVLGIPVLLLVACRVPLDRDAPPPSVPSSRPLPAIADTRLPSFAGASPEARGWTQVAGLFWVRADQAAAWAAGRVHDGVAWRPRTEAGPLEVPAAFGYRVRTDHVSLRTNASWLEAETLAREAEAHVRRFYAAYGDALDLRFPSGPLRVVAHRSRDEYGRALARVAPGHHGWGAFYDAATGTVHVSTEEAASGALPLRADLRHEMTHQMLDLSRSRERGPPTTNLWLWEGIAVAAETLGDAPGDDTGRARRERFERRLGRGEVAPLRRLFLLGVAEFEGRHYDQLAALFPFLLADGVPGARKATLDSVLAVLRGARSRDAFERRLGMTADALDRAWLASLRAGGTIGGFLDSSGPQSQRPPQPDSEPSRGGE